MNSDFATGELEHPRPGINSRIFASIASGNSVVRKQEELCSHGSEDGLDVIILCGDYLFHSMHPTQVQEAQMLLAHSFTEQHVGYRLNRIIVETMGEVQHAFNQSSGVYRTVQIFPDDRALSVLTRREAYSVSRSLAAGLFHYEEPALPLRDTDKHLLAEALQGGTDQDLAARLHLSFPSIKKRWQSLFERVAEGWPDLFPELARSSEAPSHPRLCALPSERGVPLPLAPLNNSESNNLATIRTTC